MGCQIRGAVVPAVIKSLLYGWFGLYVSRHRAGRWKSFATRQTDCFAVQIVQGYVSDIDS